MRADAVRNRAKIVEAAKAAFGERGLETQMEDVAKRACVGVGTLYRHFPTKDALVHALILDKFERMAEVAQAALEGDDDPWEAFAGVLRAGAEQQAGDRALVQVLAAQPQETMRAVAEQETKLGERMAELLARAQRAGVVREDAEPDDVPLVMCGLAAVMQSRRNWERYLQLALDGFRAPGAKLPG
ncbi:MAG TPA: helix-turn-helix domain-containing protein [Solirubrobacteraceae bacterium]|nr:helix-turn-helix domain-containing protein [Solirubrobacteraceae bacterium]